MKLYYKPGACSLATHITLHEIGADFEIEEVDTKRGQTASGANYGEINPNGYVPALTLDSGDILLEGPAILQYLADQSPKSGLAPASGTLQRARLQQHLNFVASELHTAFSPLFANNPPEEEARSAVVAEISEKLSIFERHFADGRPFLLGDQFSVADAYFFVVASWTGPTNIGLADWSNIAAYVDRVAARPATKPAMCAEGLVQ
jgi:glutathione S-transferase